SSIAIDSHLTNVSSGGGIGRLLTPTRNLLIRERERRISCGIARAGTTPSRNPAQTGTRRTTFRTALPRPAAQGILQTSAYRSQATPSTYPQPARDWSRRRLLIMDPLAVPGQADSFCPGGRAPTRPASWGRAGARRRPGPLQLAMHLRLCALPAGCGDPHPEQEVQP